MNTRLAGTLLSLVLCLTAPALAQPAHQVVDLNTAPILLETPWVFIDRYHLTDAAQRSVASILAARLEEPPAEPTR